MALQELRNRIDEIDDSMLRLFIERMEISREVAKFKIKNNLPVFQSSREDNIIKEVRDNSPLDLKNSSEILFKNIMDISKYRQDLEIFSNEINDFKYFSSQGDYITGCQGVKGAYSHIAAKKLFGDKDFRFYNSFEDVFEAVEKDKITFGLVPIQNSTAGSVSKTYELLRKYNLYIASSVSVKISHCLAVKNNTDISNVKNVYSHQQALAQCSDYINIKGLIPCEYANTAMAAQYIQRSSENIAAICSEECAENNGLKIIDRKIANADENYTRFVLISKDIYTSEKADIISVCLSLSHTPGALYRLLTKFSVAGLNLLRIESKPVASKDFSVVFYLDFAGSIENDEVTRLLTALKHELEYFKFLGNYNEVV